MALPANQVERTNPAGVGQPFKPQRDEPQCQRSYRRDTHTTGRPRQSGRVASFHQSVDRHHSRGTGQPRQTEILQLSDNEFTGCIPDGLRDVPDNDVDSLGLPFCDCSNGTSVPDPDNNPGLVSDCEALLASRGHVGGDATLNWSADTPIADWTASPWRGRRCGSRG